MNRMSTLIIRNSVITFCMFSANVIAEGTDFSSLEAQERAQIISELTFHLDTRQVCSQTLIWSDSGSGADLDGYFFNPAIGKNEYMIGGHASQKQRSKYHCVTVVSLPASTPKGAPPLLVTPVEWKQVWKDSGSGATNDGSFWQAIPPDNKYKCIGSVSQLGHNQKPDLPAYRCVHASLTDKITTSSIVWSDKGSGADKQVTIFGLSTGSFTAVASRVNSAETYDLKKNAASVPDPKMVEEILAKRLGPIKADIEAKTKAIKEQKAAAEKAKAEQEADKLAEAAAKKKQAQAEQKAKALAEQATKEEQEKLEQAQQARIAEAVAKKEAVEEANKVVIPEKEPEPTPAPIQEPVKEEVVTAPVAEEVAQPEPEATIPVETSSVSEPQQDSKGLNDILMFFAKVFGMMVGGVIIFLIIFKVLFGKKKMPTGK